MNWQKGRSPRRAPFYAAFPVFFQPVPPEHSRIALSSKTSLMSIGNRIWMNENTASRKPEILVCSVTGHDLSRAAEAAAVEPALAAAKLELLERYICRG